MKPTLSAVISAYNEENALARCLRSVQWADEIIVIDNTSTDKTKEIAKKYTSKVYTQKNNLMLNINKNYGFDKATSDWILNLDADEEVPAELKNEIQETIKQSDGPNGYWIARKNMAFGKWITHGLWWPDKQLRLFRRGSGKFSCKHIHEYIEIPGEAGQLKEPYIHYNYNSVSEYLAAIDRCSKSEAINLIDINYQLNWYDALRFPVSDFVKIYFAQSGYKDGLHGLVLALFQAFYSFVVFARVWEEWKFSQNDITLSKVTSELAKQAKEIQYWTQTAAIKESMDPLTKLALKIKRKILSS